MSHRDDSAKVLKGFKNLLKLTADSVQTIAEGIEDFEKTVLALSSQTGEADFNTSWIAKLTNAIIATSKGSPLNAHPIIENFPFEEENLKRLLNALLATLEGNKDKGKSKPAKKSAPARKRKRKKKTATGTVSELLANSEEGLSISQLLAQSNLTKNQLYSILTKLKKKEEIAAIARGIYISRKNRPVSQVPQKPEHLVNIIRTKTPKSAPPQKKAADPSKQTNTEKVYAVISKLVEPSVIDIQNYIDVDKKRLHNILFKLKKAGRIENPRRGFYRIKPIK